jgi:hypothetical protein
MVYSPNALLLHFVITQVEKPLNSNRTLFYYSDVVKYESLTLKKMNRETLLLPRPYHTTDPYVHEVVEVGQ